MMSGEGRSKSESEDPLYETMDFSASASTGPAADLDGRTLQADLTLVTGHEKKASASDFELSSSAAAMPTDIPGFEIQRELGRGAFGIVYAARDQLLDRKVAIKKPLIGDPQLRQQYIDEARKAVRLEHPGIVPIHHVGMTASGEPFVVQKLIEGSSLRGLMKEHDGQLSILQIVSIMRQVCMAVDAAHTAGIVHRDLKPENLLVEPDGRVYVADFGLAIVEDDEQVRKGREVAGTPFYMSPEQFVGRNEWLDGRSDIWALGVILYELLSGKTPFSGQTINELKDEIRNKDPRPIHQRNPKIPAAFDALFRRCCAKQVSERFATVHEMLNEVDTICQSIAVDPAELESLRQSGLVSGHLLRGSSVYELSCDSMFSRGLSTQRSMNSTVRESFVRSVFREPRMLWSFLGPVLTTVATIGMLAGAAWYLDWGPFADKQSSSEVSQLPLPSLQSSAIAGLPSFTPPAVAEPAPPAKPYVVSAQGDGTHFSISKAIEDSEAGEVITIREGTYRESIVVDRSISMVGQGDVRLVAVNDKSCMDIQSDSEVAVENVTFECQSDDHNAIDVMSGRLKLKDCDVFASSLRSYDCVKVRAQAGLSAEGCNFQSTEHAAIYGDEGSTIELVDSKISFPSNQDYGRKRCGVQASGAEGTFRRCVFVGPCLAGIDWKHSGQRMLVESCQFENCELGVQVQRCESVKLQGTVDAPFEIRNCRMGISIDASQADLKAIDVDCTGQKDRVGLQVTGGATVTSESCRFQGMLCGVLVHRSAMKAADLTVSQTRFCAMLVDEATIDLDDARLLRIEQLGLVVLSTNTQVKINSLEVEGMTQGDQRLASAIYATSGELHFTQTRFLDCLCGVCIDPERYLIRELGLARANQSVLANFVQTAKPSNQPLPAISGDQMSLTACDWAWTFMGVGSSRIAEISGDLTKERLKPQLLGPDTEKLEFRGKDLSDFRVVPVSGRP